MKVFDHSDKHSFHILNLDFDYIPNSYTKCLADSLTISSDNRGDINLEGSKIIYKGEQLLDIPYASIAEQKNAMFIAAIAVHLGLEDCLQRYYDNAESLEHRLEPFYSTHQALFLNDSKATNVEATLSAWENFGEAIAIIGGKDKNLDIEELIKVLEKKASAVLLIGETTDRFFGLLSGRVQNLYQCYTLDNVMLELKKLLGDKKQAVLFSPASSSFDQFGSFEERGKIFKKMVKEKF